MSVISADDIISIIKNEIENPSLFDESVQKKSDPLKLNTDEISEDDIPF